MLLSEGFVKSVVDQYPLKSLKIIWPVSSYSKTDDEVFFFDFLMCISIYWCSCFSSYNESSPIYFFATFEPDSWISWFSGFLVYGSISIICTFFMLKTFTNLSNITFSSYMNPTPIDTKKRFSRRKTISSKVENIKAVLNSPVAWWTTTNIVKPDQSATLFPIALSKDFPTLSHM